MKKAFDLLVSFSVLVAACTIVYSFTKNRTAKRAETTVVGRRLGDIPGITWSAHDETLVLALKKGCHYCEQSIPFYQRLSSLDHPPSVSLVAAFPDGADEVDRIIRDHKLAIPAVGDVPLRLLGVTGTPTLLLVNRQGVVTKQWVGALQPDRETEVTSAVMRK